MGADRNVMVSSAIARLGVETGAMGADRNTLPRVPAPGRGVETGAMGADRNESIGLLGQ